MEQRRRGRSFGAGEDLSLPPFFVPPSRSCYVTATHARSRFGPKTAASAAPPGRVSLQKPFDLPVASRQKQHPHRGIPINHCRRSMVIILLSLLILVSRESDTVNYRIKKDKNKVPRRTYIER